MDLRRVFDKYRIAWRDKGSNHSRGNINIACPFCPLDPSYHLAVREDGGAYFCFRNSGHGGYSLVRLFKKLSIPLTEISKNSVPFYDGIEVTNDYLYPHKKDYITVMSKFAKAWLDPECLDYLEARNFNKAEDIAACFKLMSQPEGGKWTGRIIIPLTVGWTGRSMRPHINPRYLAETDENGFLGYRCGSKSLIVVEGAFDAMRIVSSCDIPPLMFDVLAKCGNRISPAMINWIIDGEYINIFSVPDSDVDVSQKSKDINMLRPYCFTKEAILLNTPRGFKDCGEMDDINCAHWLYSQYYSKITSKYTNFHFCK